MPTLNMARAPLLLPTIFVGCPYRPPFKFNAFQETLRSLPCGWYYADTQLSTKHLLSILTTYIKAVDFCLFDLSFWNPNVALELGLAEGLGQERSIPPSDGSDGTPYAHGTQGTEFEWLVRHGMSPAKAIQAATIVDAEVLGWQDRIGSIENGKYADLVGVFR